MRHALNFGLEADPTERTAIALIPAARKRKDADANGNGRQEGARLGVIETSAL